MNDAITKALTTWYDKDHLLHFDPLHPAIGLAGEAGELLDLYKKERFKDGVSWWDCAKCKFSKDSHYSRNGILWCSESISYTPKIFDELGDLWYYLRISAYQQDVKLDILKVNMHDEILVSLTQLNYHSASILTQYTRDDSTPHYNLLVASKWFQNVLILLDTTLDYITELNWQKLNKPGNHGWSSSARKSP